MGGGLGPHVEVLRARLGLSDGQVAKIQAIRSNLLAKQVKHRTATEGLWSKMALLDQAEIPDQNKTLALMRQIRARRGKMQEEQIKARNKTLAVLTPDQRRVFRSLCPGPGAGMGWGGGWGRGMGWGGGRGRGISRGGGWGWGRGWGRGGGWGRGWGRGRGRCWGGGWDY
jgi:Spy/CpxP family protein refolding chaperone